jgi:hypothetical protein
MRFAMKMLVMPVLGATLAFGAPQGAAGNVLLSQLMIIGQPGQTGNVNRTLPSGSPGVAPFNVPAPGPFAFPTAPSLIRPLPYIGQRGELNYAEPEVAGPAERDENGRLLPSVDRAQARFTGERGADGKLLPTHVPQQAQSRPAPLNAPPAPAPTELQRERTPDSQPRTMQRREPSGQGQTGTTGTGRTQRSGSTTPSGRGHSEEYTTAVLNALAAEGYTNVGRLERVGDTYQATAMKQGRQVTVQVDPQTRRVTER